MPTQHEDMPARPGKRRPDYYWLPFFDGKVWEFVEGEDFDHVENFRAAAFAFAWRQSKLLPHDPTILKTRKLKDDQGRWHLYIQAS